MSSPNAAPDPENVPTNPIFIGLLLRSGTVC